MRGLLFVLVAVASGLARAAEPAPPEAPRPAAVQLLDEGPTRKAVADAVDKVARAKIAAENRWNDSAAGKAFKRDLDAKRLALDEARQGGSAKDKLDASAAFNAARIKWERATADALEGDQEYATAKGEEAQARAAHGRILAENQQRKFAAEAARAAAEEADVAKDPIKRAIRGKYLTIGMTTDQVELVVGKPAKLESETAAFFTVRYRERKEAGELAGERDVWVTFDRAGGKASVIRNGDWERPRGGSTRGGF